MLKKSPESEFVGCGQKWVRRYSVFKITRMGSPIQSKNKVVCCNKVRLFRRQTEKKTDAIKSNKIYKGAVSQNNEFESDSSKNEPEHFFYTTLS